VTLHNNIDFNSNDRNYQKLPVLTTTLSFEASSSWNPRISGKALRILKLESMWQPTVRISWS